MNLNFGWKPGSAMASHYVHLAHSHLRDRVRQDWEKQAAPPPPAPSASAPLGGLAISGLLAQILAELKAQRPTPAASLPLPPGG